MNEIGRRRPAHQSVYERRNTPVIVFLTVCTKNRKAILASHSVHQLLRAALQIEPSWLVGHYVIMPDHLHLFCAPAEMHPQPLTKWMSFWKSFAARHWLNRDQTPVWQRHFWDTQVRRGENYDEKWEYVVQNPVRAGLAPRSEDWPYQGRIEHSAMVNGGTGCVTLAKLLGRHGGRPSIIL